MYLEYELWAKLVLGCYLDNANLQQSVMLFSHIERRLLPYMRGDTTVS